MSETQHTYMCYDWLYYAVKRINSFIHSFITNVS